MKIWHLNWFLLKCLWETGARESKNVHPQVTVFCEVFYQEAQIIFLLNFLISQWETLYFKTKAELAENNDALAFWEGQKKLSQPREPP